MSSRAPNRLKPPIVTAACRSTCADDCGPGEHLEDPPLATRGNRRLIDMIGAPGNRLAKWPFRRTVFSCDGWLVLSHHRILDGDVRAAAGGTRGPRERRRAGA